MNILSIPIQRSQNEKGQTCVTIPWKASKWISQPAYDGRTPFEVQVAYDAVIFNTDEVERHLADDSAPEWGPDLDPSPRRMVREGAGEYEGAGHQMVIEHRLDRHGRYQVPLSMEISYLAAVAMRNTRLYQQSQCMMLTDDLTGLLSSRVFESMFAEELEYAERHNQPLVLTMIDVDL